jgi:hypothetical protein
VAPFALLALCVACWGSDDEASSGPGGVADEAPGPEAGSGTGGSSASTEALPGPCNEPAPLQLCLVGDAVTDAIENTVEGQVWRRNVALQAEVLAMGAGPLPMGDPSGACLPPVDVEEGITRSATRLAWVQLRVDGREAGLSLSAPTAALPFAVGDTVRLDYAEVDDLVRDFEPATRTLTLRDVAGELLVWVATSISVETLQSEGPSEVGLTRGAAQCEVVRTCPTFVQHAVQVNVGGSALTLTQGGLSRSSAWQVLLGRSEVIRDSMECTIDGSPQLASLGVWREPR